MESSEPQLNKTVTPTANQPIRMVKDNVTVYYSNCAMVSMSPVDMALYFGRYSPMNKESGEQVLAEVYDKQIILTYDQARNLAAGIAQTLHAWDSARAAAVAAVAPQVAQTPQPKHVTPTDNRPLVDVAPQEVPQRRMLTKEDLELEVDFALDEPPASNRLLMNKNRSSGAMRLSPNMDED